VDVGILEDIQLCLSKVEIGLNSNVMSDPIVKIYEIEDCFDGPVGGVEVFLNINWLTFHCFIDILMINIL